MKDVLKIKMKDYKGSHTMGDVFKVIPQWVKDELKSFMIESDYKDLTSPDYLDKPILEDFEKFKKFSFELGILARIEEEINNDTVVGYVTSPFIEPIPRMMGLYSQEIKEYLNIK